MLSERYQRRRRYPCSGQTNVACKETNDRMDADTTTNCSTTLFSSCCDNVCREGQLVRFGRRNNALRLVVS
jgi:hypothetical protein